MLEPPGSKKLAGRDPVLPRCESTSSLRPRSRPRPPHGQRSLLVSRPALTQEDGRKGVRTTQVQHVPAAQKYHKWRKTPTPSSLRTSLPQGQDTPQILAPPLPQAPPRLPRHPPRPGSPQTPAAAGSHASPASSRHSRSSPRAPPSATASNAAPERSRSRLGAF